MFHSRRGKKEHSGRKSERFAELGRELEVRVEGILRAAMANDGPVFAEVLRHAPFSKEDHFGKDFTVSRMVNGDRVSRSFGVTISAKSWNESKNRHPDVPQFCFPLETKPETMFARVAKLFD